MTHFCLPTHRCWCSRVVECGSVSVTATKLFNQYSKYIGKWEGIWRRVWAC